MCAEKGSSHIPGKEHAWPVSYITRLHVLLQLVEAKQKGNGKEDVMNDMNDKTERAERKLAEHESALIKAMGPKYRDDPRYGQMVREVASGRAASNAVADLRDGF